jgi:hypothetical protein
MDAVAVHEIPPPLSHCSIFCIFRKRVGIISKWKRMSNEIPAAAGKRLQSRPHTQELLVDSFEHLESKPVSGQQTKRPQGRDDPPHRGERLGAGDNPAIFHRMEPGEQFCPVDRTIGAFDGDIDEGNRSAPVQPAHQVDLAPAERTPAIEPYGQFGHGWKIGVPAIVANPAAAKWRTPLSDRNRLERGSQRRAQRLRPA